jgi:hypothetical protein
MIRGYRLSKRGIFASLGSSRISLRHWPARPGEFDFYQPDYRSGSLGESVLLSFLASVSSGANELPSNSVQLDQRMNLATSFRSVVNSLV